MISVYYFWLFLILEKGDNTYRRELYQFEAISHGNYTHRIDFTRYFCIFFVKSYLH
jgi:hypothetical protein